MLTAIALCAPVSDHLVRVDRIPGPNEFSRLLEQSWQFGGNAATAVVTVSRQGVSAGVMGTVGDDLNGRAQRVDFERHGVDVSHLLVRRGMITPHCVCLSDEETNGRSFLISQDPYFPLTEEELDLDYLLLARYLLLDDHNPAAKKAARAMLDKGGEVMFDASSYSKEQEEMLPYTSIYITSEFYWKTRYRGADIFECCRDMKKRGPHTVIFTLGKDGCAGLGPDGREFRMAAPAVPKVVDTTGCGDTFHGAYIVGMERGLDAEGCARWASAAAAIKCQAIGGRAAQPTAEMVEEFLKTGRLDPGFLDERIAYYGSPGELRLTTVLK
ncbi:MAG: PfkB family carbohydrate kinase [Treponema sp.]|jgi:sugar/nucleoside kinase (ribokinase family)|nr:PfkB family carbohydrate kinase [Treponema sp.]